MITISYLLTIAVSHFIVCADMSSDTALLTKATVGSKKLHQLVKLANEGLPIILVHPVLTTSTNNTTVFVFKDVVVKEQG